MGRALPQNSTKLQETAEDYQLKRGCSNFGCSTHWQTACKLVRGRHPVNACTLCRSVGSRPEAAPGHATDAQSIWPPMLAGYKLTRRQRNENSGRMA
eukprot:2946837-Pleurochrysis_carterae.AAC.1